MFSNGVLPEFLHSRALLASSGREFALPADASLEYLRWAHQHGFHVCGFDVWLPTDPGPTPLPGVGCDSGIEACIVAIPGILAAHGPGVVFNIWSEA